MKYLGLGVVSIVGLNCDLLPDWLDRWGRECTAR
jgi:hypothetical protein